MSHRAPVPVKALVTLALPLFAAAAVPASAAIDSARATSIACRAPANERFPAVSQLRATHTGCTTARAVAEAIQNGWQAHEGLPASFDIHAGGPVFHCRYQTHHGSENPYKTASCTSARKLVTMVLGS